MGSCSPPIRAMSRSSTCRSRSVLDGSVGCPSPSGTSSPKRHSRLAWAGADGRLVVLVLLAGPSSQRLYLVDVSDSGRAAILSAFTPPHPLSAATLAGPGLLLRADWMVHCPGGGICYQRFAAV